jgi:hypothetical protein
MKASKMAEMMDGELVYVSVDLLVLLMVDMMDDMMVLLKAVMKDQEKVGLLEKY